MSHELEFICQGLIYTDQSFRLNYYFEIQTTFSEDIETIVNNSGYRADVMDNRDLKWIRLDENHFVVDLGDI
jgi:hypothetical protein